MEHKKFLDIKAADESTIGGFEVGDHIIIQTKIDGANAAIRYDPDTDSIVAQSRKNILDSSNNLRGFYELTQLMDKNKIKEILGNRYVLFGEWLVKHSVKYPENIMNKFYCYDIYDLAAGQYLPQGMVKEIVSKLGLEYVFTWYEGEFISWEHCKSYLKNSVYGEECQEGIVVKNISKLNAPDNRQPFYVKIVNDKFKEVMKSKEPKPVDPAKEAEYKQNTEKAKTIVTKARVEKLLHKAVDEGVIPEDWTVENMKDIAKYVPREIFADCIKEEPETVAEIPEFSKIANKITMLLVKEIVADRAKAI